MYQSQSGRIYVLVGTFWIISIKRDLHSLIPLDYADQQARSSYRLMDSPLCDPSVHINLIYSLSGYCLLNLYNWFYIIPVNSNNCQFYDILNHFQNSLANVLASIARKGTYTRCPDWCFPTLNLQPNQFNHIRIWFTFGWDSNTWPVDWKPSIHKIDKTTARNCKDI